MARSDLRRALECLADPGAAQTDHAAAITRVRTALTTGGVPASDARRAISSLHRARAADPAGPLAPALIEALADAVGLRVAGDPRRAPDGAWGLSALLASDDGGGAAPTIARWPRPDHAGETWQVDCASSTRARALTARLEGARPADVSWQVDGARVSVSRQATQRAATDHWRDLGALPLPVDADGLPRPLADHEVAAALDHTCDELALGALLDSDSALSDRYVDLVDYVSGVDDSGVRASELPALRRLVTAGDELAHVRALMVDDVSALAGVARATAAELGVAIDHTAFTADDDLFTIRGVGDTRERRAAFGNRLRLRLQEAGFGHELHLQPLSADSDGTDDSGVADGWLGRVQPYTSRALVEELARANVMFLDYLPRPATSPRGRVVYLGRAGGSLYLTDHIERTLAGEPSDARVFVLSRHTAPPRLVALVRDLIDRVIYDDPARAATAFSLRALGGGSLDDLVFAGLDVAMRADPAIAADVQALHDLAVAAGLVEGLRPGAELLIVDERGHGTFPLMLAHALARAPRRAAPPLELRWFVGGNRSPMSDYARLDPARLAADFGWPSPGRVIEAASSQAEHVPHPLAGPRYRGRDVAPLGPALELDSPRVRVGAMVKNLWLYDGYLRAHAELALVPLAAARDDPRAPASLRELAARLLAARLDDAVADRYGLLAAPG